MDEGLAKAGLLEAHMAGPPPFDPQSVTFQNMVYTDAMRMKANPKMKDCLSKALWNRSSDNECVLVTHSGVPLDRFKRI